jgi:hypothetical protein
MGVNECDRRGCDNILCNRLNAIHGYICDECFNEAITRKIISASIFMEEDKSSVEETIPEEAYRAMYNQLFPCM